ncbi:Stringent starvation protein A [compost metagenome]
MTLTVYGAPLSPFVRKVRLCLLEKALDYQLEMVMPFNPPDWYLQLNPLGRIPALRDGDLTLADSSVICQYLEDAYAAADNLLHLCQPHTQTELGGHLRRASRTVGAAREATATSRLP